MRRRQTPTEVILECLEVYKNRGLKMVCQGGEGFILPRFWIFDWRDKRYSFTKTKQLKGFLEKVSLEWADGVIRKKDNDDEFIAKHRE